MIILLAGENTDNDFVLSGLIGGTIAKLLMDQLGTLGGMLVLIGSWLVLVRGYFSWSFYKPIKSFTEKVNDWRGKKELKKKLKTSEVAKRKHTKDLLSTINDQEMKQKKDSSVEEETESVTEEVTDEPPSDLEPELTSNVEAQEESELVDQEKEIDGITSPDEKSEQRQTEDKIGSGESVEVGEMVKEKYGIFGALKRAVDETRRLVYLIAVSIKKMITGSIPADSIGGPILIFQIYGEQAEQGFNELIRLTALLSINLGLLNLLPIPVLDGGHIFFFLIELLKGKPISERSRERAQQVGLFMLLSLMVFAFYNDIVRIIT